MTERLAISVSHCQLCLRQMKSLQLNLVYLRYSAVELILLPAADYFLQALQQVVAEMAVEMAAKMEMVQLQAVVGKD